MAATARAFLLSRLNDLPLKTPQLPPAFTRHVLLRPLLPATAVRATTTTTTTIATNRQSSSPAVLNCLISGVDGGGVADDFVSTRKSGFDREFSVIANMLKRIEPLDTSIISKGVSAAARDSMKRTISTMLGLLPSDQFSVTIRVLRRPLDHLLVSSIITGYTLWNAEYRLSLIRNFELSPGSTEASVSSRGREASEMEFEEREGVNGHSDVCVGWSCEDLVDTRIPQGLGDLSPEAFNYIQALKSEVAAIEKELNAQEQENVHMECNGEENNDLLEYLRSLEPNMVNELSCPSSLEVEEIIHELIQNILQKFFKDETASGFLEGSVIVKADNYPNENVELCDSIGTTRDYLAKLLFWCMLMGHHLRGLENRLHLSCVTGLL
ncbi:PREDICTED: uncharacterized protein LOC104596072 [Nelumbo nucifera]|uniref:Uncharacterized protein LOC104596072 n=2 Tax=Nelumbo nucifera TaxID=4432 RepID=A0A1U7ZPV2_NELNU|nr:PREDICTED: uncharacterized protein LOC104596072 [Nelumbo nucifera]XP_010255405.1 PREDICTED: uncharacterized protein LOC104596072 [Nelumbo nucifera]XP_010255413.1 PREDICTED: uncharacterized protein LOC104596072 [Nelumbo nucifera]DAD34722.1 TPA_asm: hypothetical protein HUJ06_005362 [Nelumbo nucifera]